MRSRTQEKTRLLLDRGANVNTGWGKGRTALLIAVGRPGSNAVVNLLLEKGANKYDCAAWGWPEAALWLAVAIRDASQLKLLLDHGADRKPLPLSQCFSQIRLHRSCFDMC